MRGIRGATTVQSNTKGNILEETTILISRMLELNNVKRRHCVYIFSVTKDLNSAFPAEASETSV